MAKLNKIIAHWAVTGYKCDATSKQHYHFIVEGDGKVVNGNHTPEANENTADGSYAAHTKGCNTGAIGVSCAAMFGAVSETNYGQYPITKAQFDSMCRLIAILCNKYGIKVTPKTVLTHAEVQGTLGIPQRGKWDIAVLPHVNMRGAKMCGDYIRKNVQAYLDTPNAKVAEADKLAKEPPKPAPVQPVPAAVVSKPAETKPVQAVSPPVPQKEVFSMSKLTNPIGTITAIITFLIGLMTQLGCAPGATDFAATCNIPFLPASWMVWVTTLFSALLLTAKALRPGGFFRSLFGSTAVVVPETSKNSGAGTVTPEQVASL